MAIPEACGLWIEQRVKEELDQRGETGASLREIGRTVAAEVEKYFETKVSPRTLEKRAGRISATNVAPAENPTAQSVSGGDSGDISPADSVVEVPEPAADPVAEVCKEVSKGTPIREASRKVAEKTGKNPETVRKAYRRETQKTNHDQDQPIRKEERKKIIKTEQRLGPDISMVMSNDFKEAYEAFIKQVADAKRECWKDTSRQAVSRCIEIINIYLEE